MSVGWDIKADDDSPPVDVSAGDYDDDRLEIEQDGDTIVLTRRQLQALSIIIDRFQDR